MAADKYTGPGTVTNKPVHFLEAKQHGYLKRI